MQQSNIHYVLDANGKAKSVIVPIKLWREIETAQETAYLLKSKTMKKRLLDAKSRTDGIPFEVVREKLGI
jgi:predicted RNA polymerase sigma factor